LRRGGFGIYFGRLHASADIWATSDEKILVRFSHAGYRHYFRVTLRGKANAATVDQEQLEHYLHAELHDWFVDVRSDAF
jgi:hypothetical protein